MRFITTISLLLLACAQAGAATPSARPGGALTLDQFEARQSERIMAADTDGDGKVSRAELDAAGRIGNAGKLFAVVDANHDGYLDSDEIHTLLARRFQRLDANNDGVLTPDERMAMRQQRAGSGRRAMPQPDAAQDQPSMTTAPPPARPR